MVVFDQFFKLQTIYFPTSPNWDFSRYQASTVVLNLGTNDNENHVSDATFETAYMHGLPARGYPCVETF
jgi:hypothetical protein